ncbi:MAG TPA: SelB C-terminal domain-containing protein, partial [Gemmatimonadaceae bacterium]|nr:SelB C-terminal domain-containing protein [Gemmatimonadaceae bacterium]
ALVAGLGEAVAPVGARLYAARALVELGEHLTALVDEHHARAPLEEGAPLQSVRARAGAEAAVADVVLGRLQGAGALEVEGALVRRRGWRPRLTPAQERQRGALLAALRAAGREPPSVGELEAAHGGDAGALLRLLDRERLVVQVEGDRYYDRSAVEEMIGALCAKMETGREYAPPELREVLGLSRKYLIPFLEYCDRVGVTERRGTGRILRQSASGEPLVLPFA